MNEENVYSLEIDGQFFPDGEPMWFHGTAGEILEKIADELGIEEEDDCSLDVGCEEIFPSVRAYRAHQMFEDRLGKSGDLLDPDSLIQTLVKEGYARMLTPNEFDRWMEEEEMDEYDNARGELGDEWADGVWET